MSFTVTYMAGGRFDAPYFPTKTEPYIEGRRIGIDDSIKKMNSHYHSIQS